MLIVDDSPSERDILRRRLERDGHATTSADDGEEALQRLRSSSFDLVLLDIMMPKLDGFGVLKQMREDSGLQRVPVIVISAADEVENVARCLEAGAEDYVSKPFNPILLRARVSACLAKKRLQDVQDANNRQLREFNALLSQRVDEATGALNRRVRELTALTDVSTSINSVMSVDLVLEKILDLSKEVLTAEASSLLVLDPAIGKLRFHVARGTAGKTLQSATVEIGKGIAGWVAQSGQPLLIANAYEDPRFDRSFDQRTGFQTRSILTVPITHKSGIAGVVQVVNKIGAHAFDERDMHLFQSFASMASVALENARLFEQTKRMADELRAALEAERWLSIEKAKMGAYIPKHVVDEITRNREEKLALGGRTVRATILFSDVVGFTRLSEQMKPHDVVAFLNEYMTAMTTIIEHEGGVVDKFIGDGIMAVFLPTEDGERPALRAVRAGIRMQQRLAGLRQDWHSRRPELSGLRTRVGINTGEVVSGNIGSETRMDYTVVGDNVNVTSRIESNARPDEVHMSEATFEEVKEHITAVRLQPLNVKNRVQPVQVYAVQVPDSS